MSDDIMKMWAGHCQRGEMSPPSPPLGPLLGPLLGTVMPLGAKAQCKPRDCFRQAYSIVKRGFKLSICCVQNTKWSGYRLCIYCIYRRYEECLLCDDIQDIIVLIPARQCGADDNLANSSITPSSHHTAHIRAAPAQIQPQICSLSNQVGHFCRGWWDCVMCAAGWARRGLMQITFFSDLN